VRRGNVRYDLGFFQTGHEFVPPHLANGWIGGCFDEFGFPSKPNQGYDQGRRHFGYAKHYRRWHNGGHNLASLLYMVASRPGGHELGLADLTVYRQELDLYTATLTTAWDDGSHYRIRSFASFAIPELFEMAFDCRLTAPGDTLAIRIEFDTAAADNHGTPHHEPDATEPPRLAFEPCETVSDSARNSSSASGCGWRVRSATNCRETELVVAGAGLTIERDGTALVVTVPSGKSVLRFLILDDELAGDARDALDILARRSASFRREHRRAAARFWEDSGNIFPPAGPAAKIWLRSKYYLAASFAPFSGHIQVPTGLNGNIWRHGFPQDNYYGTENLPRLNLLDLARAQMPYWLDNLDAVKRYTRRIADRDGAFYPWIPPFENWDDFEKDGPTNRDAFEFHNSAYVAAMPWHYYLATLDRPFLEKHFPIIEEVARFYLSLTVAGPDRGFIVSHPLARSQDEASGENDAIERPLCCTWSAIYTLRAYREACGILGRTDGNVLLCRAEEVLAAGYDLGPLQRPEGMLRAYANDTRPLGQQKHPVQLNPIAYLPMADWMDDSRVRTAWARRYDLTSHARQPHSPGWTLAEFALASARMRSGADLAHDLRQIQPARLADPMFIQFYESSDRLGWSHKKAYYFTTHGLYLQAITDAVVQDCRGILDLFAALLPEWETDTIRFSKIRTRGALRVSGVWRRGAFRVTIEPERDVTMPVRVSRDVRGIRMEDADGAIVREFDGGQEVSVNFRAGQTVTLCLGEGI
jgi:hypothetical protein